MVLILEEAGRLVSVRVSLELLRQCLRGFLYSVLNYYVTLCHTAFVRTQNVEY